ncbi:unnamed protein product, partial [Iphiclides podalirius]
MRHSQATCNLDPSQGSGSGAYPSTTPNFVAPSKRGGTVRQPAAYATHAFPELRSRGRDTKTKHPPTRCTCVRAAC